MQHSFRERSDFGRRPEIHPPLSSADTEARIAEAQAASARAEADKAAAEAAKASAEAAKVAAETEKAKEQQKAKNAEDRKKAGKAAVGAFGALGTAAKVAVVLVPVAIIIAVFGLVVPMLTSHSETKYFAESDLKAVVNIESLSTVDYAYTGIAEKPGKFLWMDNIAYRVKYEARVEAKCNMSQIEFAIDQEGKTVTAYLPEAEIGEPTLVSNSFDYLPSDTSANISDVIQLCKEDAANDVDRAQIQQEAYESLQDTVRALTMPLLSEEGWTLKFATLAEYVAPATTDESDEEAATEAAEASSENAETEANNEAE